MVVIRIWIVYLVFSIKYHVCPEICGFICPTLLFLHISNMMVNFPAGGVLSIERDRWQEDTSRWNIFIIIIVLTQNLSGQTNVVLTEYLNWCIGFTPIDISPFHPFHRRISYPGAQRHPCLIIQLSQTMSNCKQSIRSLPMHQCINASMYQCINASMHQCSISGQIVKRKIGWG